MSIESKDAIQNMDSQSEDDQICRSCGELVNVSSGRVLAIPFLDHDPLWTAHQLEMQLNKYGETYPFVCRKCDERVGDKDANFVLAVSAIVLKEDTEMNLIRGFIVDLSIDTGKYIALDSNTKKVAKEFVKYILLLWRGNENTDGPCGISSLDASYIKTRVLNAKFRALQAAKESALKHTMKEKFIKFFKRWRKSDT
ncbi:hypothetical protein ACFL08_00735 [Patescibacteria group bacterium]